MKFQELQDSLPNGFHDADLSRLSVDYVAGTVEFDTKLWIGSMQAPPEERETYRPARVVISGLQYCAIEPPHPKCPSDPGEPLTFDGREVENDENPKLPAKKEGNFLLRFFINEWNSNFWISAESISLNWTGPEEIKTYPED